VRKRAVEQLTDQSALTDIAKNDRYSDVRLAAVERLTDQSVLTDIARTEMDSAARKVAVGRVLDLGVIDDVAKWDKYSNLRAELNYVDPMVKLGQGQDPDRVAMRAVAVHAGDEKVLADIAKHGDYAYAETRAVEVKMLAGVAASTPHHKVAESAMATIQDERAISQIAVHSRNSDVRMSALIRQRELKGRPRPDKMAEAAIRYINDEEVLADIAKNTKYSGVRLLAVRKHLGDQQLLAALVKNGGDAQLRREAMKDLVDQDLLADIANNASSVQYFDTHVVAVERLTDQRLLADIARNHGGSAVRKAAMERLTDQGMLADIVRNNENSELRAPG